MKIPNKMSVEELASVCKGKSGKSGEAEVSLSWTKKDVFMSSSVLSVVSRLVERNKNSITDYTPCWFASRNKSDTITGYELGRVELVLNKATLRSPETLIQKNTKAKAPPELSELAARCDKKSGDEFAEGGVSYIKGEDFVTFETSIPHQAAKLIRRNPDAIESFGVTEDPVSVGTSFSVWFKVKAGQVRGFEYITTTGNVRSPRPLPAGFGKKKVDIDYDDLE